MTAQQAAQLLHHLARQWQRTLYAGAALKSLGAALLITLILGLVLAWSMPVKAVFGAGCFAVVFILITVAEKIASVDALLIAHHLNRTVPKLEESSALTLKPEAALTVLEKMQRKRVLEAMSALQTQQLLPRRALRAAWVFFAAATTAALVAALAAPLFLFKTQQLPASGKPAQSAAVTRANLPLQILAAQIEISPPAYTGKAKRQLAQFDLDVEEGAEIFWRLTLNQKLKSGALLFSDGDTVTVQQESDKCYRARRRIFEKGFYSLRFEKAGDESHQTDFYEIEVTEDLPPAITVNQPAQRTEILPESPAKVQLQVEVEDDYGIAATELVATVARGSGEAVKFREAALPFDAVMKKSTRHWDLRKALNLAGLGMAAGDELYFFIEARDNREPVANRSRSETYFITLRDTAALAWPISGGLLANPMPEYFRSQRQIIIDTEKLIRERKQLSENEFKRRANILGLDQQALRFRYGQFLGDEFEDEAPEHKDETEEGAAAGSMQNFVHAHDSEENATLFAPSIKAQLKASLAQMWEAELRLRTHKPEEALPFEYRALELLKDLQQRSRLYVQRVGFEPTPIKVDEKRLTGDLAAIAERHSDKKIAAAKSFASARQALHFLQTLEARQPIASDVNILEKAGQEMSRQAIEQPELYLPALRDLRTLITAINGKTELPRDALLSAQRGLWNLLPPEQPLPARPHQTNSALAERYLRKIGGPQ